MTLLEFKAMVKAAKLPDEKLGHTYDRLSKAFGYKDWNTMRATYPWTH